MAQRGAHRKTAERIALSKVIAEFRRMAFTAQGGICALCGHPMPYRETRQAFKARRMDLQPTAEHVIPQGWSGCVNRGPGNLVCAHWKCNHDRGHRAPTGCELIWLLAVNARLGVHPQRW